MLIQSTSKKCANCLQVKSTTEFYSDKSRKDGFARQCSICDRIRTKLWNQNNPERKREAGRKWSKENPDKMRLSRWKKYGLDFTPEQFNIMLVNQKECCAICHKHYSEFKRMLVPDHDHTTGKVRGLFCGQCNVGIGMFHDSIKLLENAQDYLCL